jgi:glycosyltransferase involved in cell wall biosynthesis
MRIALIYDRANKIGGAERVLETIHKIWPEAPLYTSICNPRKAPWTRIFNVKTSFLQLAKFLPHEILPNLMPLAFKSFDFKNFDSVISVSSAEGKYVRIKKPTKHICYCLTPTRYLWSGYFDYLKNPGFGKFNSLIRFWFVIVSPLMRLKDFEEAQKIDEFVAISKEVESRIKKYYRRKSEIVYPPINFYRKDRPPGLSDHAERGARDDQPARHRYAQALAGGEVVPYNNYFLIVSRLVPYKEIDLAIRVFNNLPDKKLILVGTGSEEKRLKLMAKPNIIFKGKVADSELKSYYQRCLALIFPGVEDLGLTSLEAQLFNKPVVCRQEGGTKETILIGKTGEIFNDETGLKRIINNFDQNIFCEADFKNNLAKFQEENFIQKFKYLIENL